MKAVRLHGARDLRLEDVAEPPPPGAGEVLLAVGAVGICGSDLHMVEDGRIGDTEFASPLVIGHEFMGTVVAVGPGALDGHHRPLRPGRRVAVDPAVPDETHELFEEGHPNLVPAAFYGLYPDAGALQERMLVRARNCFVLPDAVGDGAGTLLETLGVALHAVDLARIRVGDTVAVIGVGPVGLLIARLAVLAGAAQVFAFDRLGWRVEKARSWAGAVAWRVDSNEEAEARLNDATAGRGADVVVEAAWADESTALAAELARLGGRLVLVGIPGDDALTMKHSTARRKGLTIRLSRRMKHTYPRAIALASAGRIELDALVSHRFPLERAPEAFELNLRYAEGVHKIVIEP